jgi:hypothetical protein
MLGPRALLPQGSLAYPVSVTPTLEARRREPFDLELDPFSTESEDMWAGDAPSPLPVAAVLRLIDEARSERASMSRFSLGRAYYVGVEAAAEQVLHPERQSLRLVPWLDRYNPAFVSGYLETTALLAPFWSWPPNS